ncbi:long-chain fatty acid--CoA ligase [Schaalia meyeri]|uniref:Long-chain fatty acid--CoA ligase n=1 Tax=Schaalia meyeri TaxID=52773 RepID=A0AAP9Y7X5_9ACTO|nr:AMP-dependent synthetase/ligase [Schaalia meyeri]AKU64857.1 long-chain fatty acid--CoA ligase [Schaalia meyeri]QQC44473.1 long-chain fatty acid--CoA ligase [Schaalia meyeri]SDR64683.1 long-chain acyl-CoA synthetase [Schaalia meyeri]
MKRMRDGSYTIKPTYTVGDHDIVPDMLIQRALAHPDQVAVEQRSSVGAARHLTAAELQRQVEYTACGLIGLGIESGHAVAILAPTSYEWLLLDLALLSIGAITVPIYESDSAAQIEHILTDAHVTRVFTATTQQAELVRTVTPSCTISVDSFDRGALRKVARAAADVTIEDVQRRRATIASRDVATIIYTSGTTGTPKGVALTHANFIATAQGARQILGNVIDSPSTRLLLFLPVAHVLARLVMHVALSGQGVLGFSPNIKNLLPDIQAFQPSVLLVVPRVLEKVYNAASAKAGGGLRGRVFAWSAKQARSYSLASEKAFGPGPIKRMRHGLADALVLKKIRSILGPNLRYIVSGGAPLATDLAHFYSGMGFTLLQGYGLSETTGPIAVQHIGKNPVGTVGLPLPGNFIKIAKDGEILVRGQSVMPGYYHLPEQTAEVMTDGTWFHTGDLGSIDRRGQLTITGRKKELIVTAGGKNVSPEVLEDALATHPLIANVIVVGDQRPYVGALFTLDADMLPTWLSKHGLPTYSPTEAAALPQVRDSLERAVERANRVVSRAESIRKFRIIDATFTVENGYVTPSMKLRRRKVLADYAFEVDALYGGPVSAEPTKKRRFFGLGKKK